MSPLSRTPFDDLDPGAVLRAQDIAERLRVDARSVRRAISSGALPASRVCGLRVLAADAAAWWRAQSVRVAANSPNRTSASPDRSEAADSTFHHRRRRFERPDSAERLPLPPRAGSR